MSMFCFQCQETAKGTGCTVRGVCGKKDDVAVMQDLLIYVMKGIAVVAMAERKEGAPDKDAEKFIMESLFATITNANFNRSDFIARVKTGLALREAGKFRLTGLGGKLPAVLHDAVTWTGATEAEFDAKAVQVGVLATENEDVRSLRQMLTYGVKGMAAYAEHAYVLGYQDEMVFEFIERALASTLDDSLTADELVGLVMECGKFGVSVMALLDRANTLTYGNPEITTVDIGVRTNPGILISGHDLKDLEELLEQTAGTGIDVYTHGEMLPAHYYPFFKKYPHFAGNYGNAWYRQDKEFDTFNGADSAHHQLLDSAQGFL